MFLVWNCPTKVAPTSYRARGHVSLLFYRWLHDTGAARVEQKTKKWPNCTDHHESAHQNDWLYQYSQKNLNNFLYSLRISLGLLFQRASRLDRPVARAHCPYISVLTFTFTDFLWTSVHPTASCSVTAWGWGRGHASSFVIVPSPTLRRHTMNWSILKGHY